MDFQEASLETIRKFKWIQNPQAYKQILSETFAEVETSCACRPHAVMGHVFWRESRFLCPPDSSNKHARWDREDKQKTWPVRLCTGRQMMSEKCSKDRKAEGGTQKEL